MTDANQATKTFMGLFVLLLIVGVLGNLLIGSFVSQTLAHNITVGYTLNASNATVPLLYEVPASSITPHIATTIFNVVIGLMVILDLLALLFHKKIGL